MVWYPRGAEYILFFPSLPRESRAQDIALAGGPGSSSSRRRTHVSAKKKLKKEKRKTHTLPRYTILLRHPLHPPTNCIYRGIIFLSGMFTRHRTSARRPAELVRYILGPVVLNIDETYKIFSPFSPDRTQHGEMHYLYATAREMCRRRTHVTYTAVHTRRIYDLLLLHGR